MHVYTYVEEVYLYFFLLDCDGSVKRDNFAQFFKIYILSPQGRVSPQL